jgi:hypothetical protein
MPTAVPGLTGAITMDSSKVASGTIIVVITTVNGLTCVAAPFPSLAVTLTVVSAAFHD